MSTTASEFSDDGVTHHDIDEEDDDYDPDAQVFFFIYFLSVSLQPFVLRRVGAPARIYLFIL